MSDPLHTDEIRLPSPAFQARYRVLGELGRGAMGVVYRAEQVDLGREVAVKFPTVDRMDARDRVVREAKMLSDIAHPHIVRLFDAGYDEERPYVVMEFVEGRTLDRLLRDEGPLPVRVALAYACQILEGLAAAHAAGIVHRDVKPENVIVTARGVAKLADFGLARLLSAQRLTAVGMLMGTPAYMAPEYVSGLEPDARCDLYSAGVTLYQLLTGRLPIESDDANEMLTKQMTTAPLPLLREDVPADVEAIVMRALSKSPGQRPPSALAMAADIKRALGDPSSGSLSLSGGTMAAVREELAGESRRAARVLTVLVGVLVVAVLAALGAGVLGR